MKLKHLLLSLSLCLALTGFYCFTSFAQAEERSDIVDYVSIGGTEEGMVKYKDNVKKINSVLAKEKGVNVIATITFTRPISYDELANYIKIHEIKPSQVQSRAISNGERLTISSKYSDNLNEVVTSIIDDYNNNISDGELAQFKGYTDIYATVKSEDIPGIESDPNTFLLDASSDENFGTKTGKTKYQHSLTWLLEDLQEK